ncbi:MAG: hypothetical protein ACRD3V_04020 [Vicinamibacteria bacterium]
MVALLLAIAGNPRAPVALLRESGSRSTGKKATSVVLLVGAGLVLRSFHEIEKLDPGFRRQGVLTSSIVLAGSPHVEPERQTILFRQIRESVAAIPEVSDVALVNHLPIGGDIWSFTFFLEGAEAVEAAELPLASVRTVTPSYFQTMGAPLLAGRDLLIAKADSRLGSIALETLF